jgi:histidine triad (HIT) family protein
MSQECVFCQIIRKEAPASMVYENDKVVAFLSNRPVNEGHTLVVPKRHYNNIYEMPEDEVGHLFAVAKRLAVAVRDSMAAEGIRIVQNNGWAAGQVIFHVHVHIIPLKIHEGFTHGKAYRSPTNERAADWLEKDAEKIRKFISK